ncbi:hypothetical protein LTR09_005144 [Extremus antarcticus]|uniref:F-box domain-containing protein n=1 Tax=Extremus antarcticus TaxID=702011 RepID=A0AAJ0DNL5_9PEZI|nr:hypothetical protein LTR09_005144 [Extremus antarcticus]
MANLGDLPAELINQIVWFLDTDSVFSVRQVNRYLENSSFKCFSTRYFRKKGFLLTSDSLNVLKSIGRNQRLRETVHHLWFNPDCYTSTDSGRPSTPIKDDIGHCMRRSEDHQPWGWKRLKDATGQDPRIVGPYRTGAQDGLSDPTLLFVAMVNAAAEANLELERLYTDAIEIDNIPLQLLPQQQLDIACRELLYLEVNIHKGWFERGLAEDFITSARKADYGEGLLRLLKASPKLRELGLQVFAEVMRGFMLPPSTVNPEEVYDGVPSRTVDQFSWLQAYPHLTLKKLAGKVEMTTLRRVKLEKMTTTPATLEAFLRPSQASLTSIKLRDFRLLSSKESSRPWQSIFSFFRGSCPNLSYILLNRLMYELGTICFVEHPPKPAPYRTYQDPNDYPNPAHFAATDDGFFTKYDHIALEARGRAEVEMKLEQIVDKHWYQQPFYSYEMDEDIWHTDTSDEES